MSSLAKTIVKMLSEQFPITTFSVDYWYITENGKGARTGTRMTASIHQLYGDSRSETAVLGYLKQRHPGCEIQINQLTFQ